MPDFEWDEVKRNSNVEKHGLDFQIAQYLEWDLALTVDQLRGSELRHLSYVPLNGRLHAIVWTERNMRIRIISLRKANNREIRAYEKEMARRARTPRTGREQER